MIKNYLLFMLPVVCYHHAEKVNNDEKKHEAKTKEDIEIEKLQKTIDVLTKKLELLEKEDTISMYSEGNKSFSKINKKEIEKINKSLADLKAQIYVIDKKLKEADLKKTLNAKNEEFKELSDENKQKDEREKQEKLNKQKKLIEEMEAEMRVLELKLSIHEKQMKLATYKKYEIDALSKKIAENEELKLEVEKLKLQVEQDETKLRLAKVDLDNKRQKLVQENENLMQLTLKNEILKQEKDNLRYQVDILKNQELLRQEKLKAREQLSSGVIQYLENPLRDDGVLVLSDRQIKLGLIINGDAANLVSRLIDFYNNDEEHQKYPIFLIFDGCWGGECNAMNDIINKMKQSKSPVYVVVKKWACSAAAIITTCAEKSFICRGAKMMHHQMNSWGGWQNVRKWEEYVKYIKSYAKKILEPMLSKLKCTYEQFVDKMYKNSCDGEGWYLLDQDAVNEKWVDRVITGIRDTSVLSKNENEEYKPLGSELSQAQLTEQINNDLNLGKFWYIYLGKQNPA